MMIKNIKIKDIKISKNRFRPISEYSVKNLSENIEAVGLLEPIIVSQNNMLLAGNHRLEAFKLLKREEISCHIYTLDLGDNGEFVEYSENEFRKELTLSERNNVYLEMRKLRDSRKKNGGNDTRKIETSSKEDVSISNKERDKKSKEITKSDAIEAGFSSGAERTRVSRTVVNGIPEVIEAMDKKEITPTRASKIAGLPKDKQLKALENKDKKETEQPKESITKTKKKAFKHNDKFGTYAEIKIYQNDPEQTAKNIAKNFGDKKRNQYIALLIELSRELSLFGGKSGDTREADLYKMFSYGLTSVSDGEVSEIKELLKIGIMSKASICEAFCISASVVAKINNL